MRGRGHGRSVFERSDKGIEFPLVGLRISLQEEIQERFARLRFGLAPTPDGGRAQIVVEEHSGRPKNLQPLIVAIDRLAQQLI